MTRTCRSVQRCRDRMAGLLLGLALSIGYGTIANGVESASVRWPVTPQQRGVADQVAQAGVPLSALASNAPDEYVVKARDTLWDISSLFLTSPWRWPELWGMNREQIRNPHLIYPGQRLRLVKIDGRAYLNLVESDEAPAEVVKLSPRIRDEGPHRQAIASIPAKRIEPFLTRPLIVTADELERAPRVVATQEGRVFLGRGDIAYVRGVTDPKVRAYYLYRPARPLFDPDDEERKTPIGYESFYLGAARVTRAGDVTTLQVEESVQEIGVGDRLMPLVLPPPVNYVPHPTDKPVDGRIVSIYSGVEQAGTFSIVALNRGARDGLEIGHVLGLLDVGATIVDRTDPDKPRIKLPDELIGELFVFRVAETLSYGLIMRVTRPVKLGDRLAAPDPQRLAQYSR